MNLNSSKHRDQAVAIVGLAGRFPGANTIEQYWKNLCEGIESLTQATDEELLRSGLDPELLKEPRLVRAAGVIEDADCFDALFFGFSAREAETIDPQQRVFLECAWEALEDAGYDPQNFPGAIGVFAGAGMNTYAAFNLQSNPEVVRDVGAYQLMVANDKDFLATRVAYKLDLRGPAISVQTACSTSLVAVQTAFESLRRGECDMALAGGVSIYFPQNSGYLYVPGMILSPDGHCRPFDAKAAGTVPGRGAGIVVLKRLADAVRDNDRIYAVIRGAAVNNDGAAKVGYSAPSVEGQSRAIRSALQMAGLEAGCIRYVEAHGTGTEVGDPIEIAALTQAFRSNSGERQFCAIGSVKSNIGHLDTAAGVAGLIKTALTLYHRKIPPTLHFRQPNEHIEFGKTPFYVNTALKEYTDPEPFRAAVSSFGIGGTNAHAILEEWRPTVAQGNPDGKLMVISARTEQALHQCCRNLAHYLDEHPSVNLDEVAFTLQTGRRAFSHRRFLVGRDSAEIQEKLLTREKGRTKSVGQNRADQRVIFLFPGQGSQYVNMGRGLYETTEAFRFALDRCSEILAPHLGLNLQEILYPPSGGEEKAQELLNQTWITQPALFTVEYATAQLWARSGVQPAAMAGHSVGEYVCACLAGAIGLEDALGLIAARGKLIQALPPGAMLAVLLPEAEVRPLLPPDLSIAAINSWNNTIVSGPIERIDEFEASLQTRGIRHRRIRTSHAFHSAMMEPVLEAFAERLRLISFGEPSIPYVSNLSGKWITAGEVASPEYWVKHLRGAVRFADCIEELSRSSPSSWVEAGPGETLLGLTREHLGKDTGTVAVSSMRHPMGRENDRDHWLQAVGHLWLTGVSPLWESLYPEGRPGKVSLPTYPFERNRFWIEPKLTAGSTLGSSSGLASGSGPNSHDDLPSRNADISSWFYVPTWRRSPNTAVPVKPDSMNPGTSLLFVDTASAVADVIRRAAGSQGRTITVTPGARFARTSKDAYQIRPADRQSYESLFEQLAEEDLWPERIVHAYALGPDFRANRDASLDYGFFSIMYLAQSLARLSHTRPIELNVLTANGAEVFGDARCDAKAMVIHGICKVLPLEQGNITCRILDIDHAETSDSLEDQLRLELQLPAENQVIARRGRNRWIPAYEPVMLPEDLRPAIDIPRHATFLITGGLGGIGLAWARFLAKHFQARVALTSRSGLPAPTEWEWMLNSDQIAEPVKQRIRAVTFVRELGGEVLTLTADTGDRTHMTKAVEATRARFGNLFGVIHAAGVAEVGPLEEKTQESAMNVLHPKLHGTDWIEPLLAREGRDGLRLVLLCSSISALFPSSHLSDYCAANAYLDGFALAHDNPKGTRVLATNWDTWSETGMAFDRMQGITLPEVRAAVLGPGISNDEAQQIFPRLLAYPVPQLLVSKRDPRQFLQVEKIKRQHSQSLQGEATTLHSRPTMTQQYTEPSTPTELCLVEIWQEVLGVNPIGSHDNFFELGGHSLLGVQLLVRIQERFGAELPLRSIFESPTPSEMAKLLHTIPWMSGNSWPSPSSDLDREEIEI